MSKPPSPALPKGNAEFAELVATSGRNQIETAAYLTRRLGSDVANYQVSKWASGKVRVPSEVLDAMRELAAQPAATTPIVAQLTETSDVVPLFGYANAAGATLRINEDQRVGVVPIHPAQRGSRSAFAFIVYGDSVSPLLSHGDIGYAVRGHPPLRGRPCLIELQSGEALVKIFEGFDENTLFTKQLQPKKDYPVPLRDVAAVHAVVGVTFG